MISKQTAGKVISDGDTCGEDNKPGRCDTKRQTAGEEMEVAGFRLQGQRWPRRGGTFCFKGQAMRCVRPGEGTEGEHARRGKSRHRRGAVAWD